MGIRESYALERLREPSPNGRWGILCDAKYSFAWEAYENLDFDPFELDDLGLDWPASRLAEIELIEDLTPEELAQWRIGAAQLTISSGDTSVAWIVALERPGLGQRWALFVGHTGCAPEDEPGLAGISVTLQMGHWRGSGLSVGPIMTQRSEPSRKRLSTCSDDPSGTCRGLDAPYRAGRSHSCRIRVAQLDSGASTGVMYGSIKSGLTPTPTCQPGQGGSL